MKNFADRLIEKIGEKKSVVCVGLDPRLNQIPKFIKEKALKKCKNKWQAAGEAILEFNKGIIDSVHDLVPCVKPQIAFYEMYGEEGIHAYNQTIKYAKKKDLLVIADAKRNDIGSTAEAYAKAFLGEVDLFDEKKPMFDADALTVTPYLGWDGIKPFVEVCKNHGKGIFILVKTSNPSSGDIQDVCIREGNEIFDIMGQYVESWGANETGESGYSFVGAVVGATYPKQAKRLRILMPNSIFLVPGYGAQGGSAEDVKPCFNGDGLGAIVNSSRGIIFAYEKSGKYGEKDFDKAAKDAVIKMNGALNKVI